MYRFSKNESGSGFYLVAFGHHVKLSRDQSDALQRILPEIEKKAGEDVRREIRDALGVTSLMAEHELAGHT